jgi:hypothetical protein
MAKLLTPHQEQIILNRLREMEYVSRGSSRIVFDCPDDIKYMLGLNACLPYVIKLSVGSGGIAQTDAELSMFLDNGRQYLAEVFYFGHFLMICESVDTDEWLDLAEDIHGDDSNDELLDVVDEYLEYNFNWDGTPDDIKRRNEYEKAYMDAAVVIRFLASFNGRTSDNGQLGTSTHDGRLVAYDYGFIAGKGCDTQCSGELVDNISGDEVRFNEYIDELVQVLEEMKETYMKLDEILYRTTAVEEHINNTVNLEWKMRHQRISGSDLEEVNEDDDLEFGWNCSTEETCSSCC